MTETKERAPTEKKLKRTATEKAERAKYDGAIRNKKCEFIFHKVACRIRAHVHAHANNNCIHMVQ